MFSSAVVQAIRPSEYSRPVVGRGRVLCFAMDAESPQQRVDRRESKVELNLLSTFSYSTFCPDSSGPAGARKRCES